MDKTRFKDSFQNFVATTFTGESGLKNIDYDFSIGDSDLSTDPRIVRFAMDKALEGDTHYGIPSGKTELKSRIVNFHKKYLNQDITLDNIQVTSSASHAMYLVMQALCNPGDEIILFAPYFANYYDQVALNDGVPVIVNTHYDEGFEINESELRKAITPKTKAIIFNNPTNPTGHLYSDESLEILRKVTIEKNLIVICDDIYTTYTFRGKKFKSLSTLPDMFHRSIQIRSFSKDFLMTGWRIGYIVADKELVDVTKAINESIVYSPSAISQNAAIMALDLFDEIAAKNQEIYAKRLDIVYKCMEKSRYFNCLPPEGTFYVFMNIEKTRMDDVSFCKFIEEKARVKAFPGSLFGGKEYNRFVRLAINMEAEKIEQAFAILEVLEYPGE